MSDRPIAEALRDGFASAAPTTMWEEWWAHQPDCREADMQPGTLALECWEEPCPGCEPQRVWVMLATGDPT